MDTGGGLSKSFPFFLRFDLKKQNISKTICLNYKLFLLLNPRVGIFKTKSNVDRFRETPFVALPKPPQLYFGYTWILM
jgi:hypothetical protein